MIIQFLSYPMKSNFNHHETRFIHHSIAISPGNFQPHPPPLERHRPGSGTVAPAPGARWRRLGGDARPGRCGAPRAWRIGVVLYVMSVASLGIYIHTYIHICICMYIYIYVYIHVYMCICIYVYMYMYMYGYVCICM